MRSHSITYGVIEWHANGDGSYEITFPGWTRAAGNGFWLLTVYNEQDLRPITCVLRQEVEDVGEAA
jgi:hypothetical protein